MSMQPIGSACELLGLYDTKRLSPTEVVEEALRRIEDADPNINAFRTTLPEQARREAEECTHRLMTGDIRGALHGIPVAVKELFDVAGARVSYGSRLFANRVASQDAVAVKRLREAGAIVIGMTRSHEFGWGITTQHETLGGTRNPWDVNRVPGGSSGGAAAAVAMGMVPISLGSDTGGSIRIPASFCGVAGLKPTYGSISCRGAVPLAPSLDHVGAIAAHVEDLALVWNTLRFRDRRDGSTEIWSRQVAEPTDLVRGLRLGLAPAAYEPPLRHDVLRVIENAKASLVSAGCELVELKFPPVEYMRATFATIQLVEAYHIHSRVLSTFPARRNEYGSDVRMRLDVAASIPMNSYLEARSSAVGIRDDFVGTLCKVDVLLSPVSAGGPSMITAPDQVAHMGGRIEFRDLVMNYTTPHNLIGLPSCSVAIGIGTDGIPIGVQVTARHGNEEVVLKVAAALQRLLPMPSLPASGNGARH